MIKKENIKREKEKGAKREAKIQRKILKREKKTN